MKGETMETKIKFKRITDFKNDLVFKFMLSDLMILAVIIYLKSLLKESLVLNVRNSLS